VILGVPALTAWRAVTIEGDVAGKPYSLQVVRCCRSFCNPNRKSEGCNSHGQSGEKAAHAHQAGADYILNHRTESVVERVKEITNGKGVDLEHDIAIANASILPDIIAPHGTVAVCNKRIRRDLPILRFIVDSVSIRFFIVYEFQSIVRQAVFQI